jgi:hypothetical protein
MNGASSILLSLVIVPALLADRGIPLVCPGHGIFSSLIVEAYGASPPASDLQA